MAVRDGQHLSEAGLLRSLAEAVAAFGTWPGEPEMPRYTYPDIVEHPHAVVGAIAEQFGHGEPVCDIVDALLADTASIAQFNRGVCDQYRTELQLGRSPSSRPHTLTTSRNCAPVHRATGNREFWW